MGTDDLFFGGGREGFNGVIILMRSRTWLLFPFTILCSLDK